MRGARVPSCSRGSRTAPRERAYTRAVPPTPSRPAGADAALIDRLATDETGEAMREFYRLYGGELFGFALNALGDRGAAEEIVQEVFLRAWRHAGTYDPQKAAVRTWLFQITRHAIIDARRGREHHVGAAAGIGAERAGAGAPARALAAHLVDRLRAGLQPLDPEMDLGPAALG